jgi:hypothetical protein
MAGIAVVEVEWGLSLLIPGSAGAFGSLAAIVGMVVMASMALNHVEQFLSHAI